jgi:hypothetical protein
MNTQANTSTSNILGATGLSKRTLAAYFRQTGLFGRDSSLSREQQAAVYSRLPAIEGLRVPVVNLQPTSQLRAIAELTESAVAEEDLAQARARARSQGVSDEVIAEICTVVANALLLFGPFSATATLPLSARRTAVPLSAAA